MPCAWCYLLGRSGIYVREDRRIKAPVWIHHGRCVLILRGARLRHACRILVRTIHVVTGALLIACAWVVLYFSDQLEMWFPDSMPDMMLFGGFLYGAGIAFLLL